jgi:hypothetical protein
MALKFRRGTTAQQSGSLAYGEPYVNTTLGTLLIGGPDGDIVLGTSGTGSTGNFGAISGSGLDITGNANIAGNLTLGGNITIGNATTDNVVINADLSSSLIPNDDNAFDIGSTSKRYKAIYGNIISGSSLELVSGSGTELKIRNTSANTEWHVRNTTAGNFSIHNAVSNVSAFTIASASVGGTTATYMYSNLYVSGQIFEVVGGEINAPLIYANNFSASAGFSGSINGIGNVSAFSSSIAGRFTTLATLTGSNSTRLTALEDSASTALSTNNTQATSITNLNTTTASLNTSVSNLNTFSASENGKAATLATYTGSVEGRFTTLATLTGSNGTRLTALEVETANLETFSASTLTRLSNLETTSGSVNTRLTEIGVVTGSLISSASAAKTTNDAQGVSITNLNTLTASALTRFTALEVETANLELTTASLNISVTNLNTFSASENSKTSTLATYTGSNDTKWSTLGSLSGSFARTNSTNVFTGNQTITGSLFVSQDLIVAGSSSIQNISSSNLVIGAAFVTLNTITPSSRFAGLHIIDSGSAGVSGSFLYDAVQDEMIFVHRGNGTNVTSSIVLMGPQTYDNLGNETYLTNNRIVKSTGLEHIVDSQISDDGSTVSIPGALTVTGNITGPIRATNGVVSGSSQITYSGLSGIPAGIISGSSQITSTLPTGVVSGSSQIAHDSTTGFSANRHIDHTTVSVTAGSGLTGGGDISTTRTISIATGGVTDGMLAGSISNAKLTNSTITIAGTSTALGSSITAATILQGTGVVSGSSQVIGILSSLNTYTGSNDTTNTTQNSRLDQLSTASGSALTRLTALEVETSNLETFSASALTRLSNLEGKDISITLTGDVTGTGTITDLANVSFATTIAANSVALGTDTTGDYVASMTAGTGITVGTATGEGSTPVITNTGVTSNVAGNAITVSGATGAVTINHADTSTAANLSATSRTYVTALTFDTYGHVTAYSTGTETVTDTNTVTTNIAGTGVAVSSGTGNSTISIGQAVATSDNVRFNSLGIGMAASATAGRIDATNDIVAFSSSDIRFKENIKPIENALDKIRKISGNTYDWKAENKAEHGYEGNDVGVIAQEIEAVLPQLVQTRENGYKAVKYDKLVALLIEGIKDQQLQIEQLRIDLNNCRNKGL